MPASRRPPSGRHVANDFDWMATALEGDPFPAEGIVRTRNHVLYTIFREPLSPWKAVSNLPLASGRPVSAQRSGRAEGRSRAAVSLSVSDEPRSVTNGTIRISSTEAGFPPAENFQ